MRKVLLVVVLLVVILAACGDQEDVIPATPPTPMLVSKCDPPAHPFGFRGIEIKKWKHWDGSTTFFNSNGSRFDIMMTKANTVIVKYQPIDSSQRIAGEYGFTEDEVLVVALSEKLLREQMLLIAGPIIITKCGDGFLISDEHYTKEVIINYYDLRPDGFPGEWYSATPTP